MHMHSMKGPLHAGQLFIESMSLFACNGMSVLGVIVCRLMRLQVSATQHLLTGVIVLMVCLCSCSLFPNLSPSFSYFSK